MEESRKKYPLFGEFVEIVLFESEEPFATTLMDDAYKLGLRLQKIFNIYDEKSEISKLNKERSIRASTELLNLLSKALDFCKLSNGEYDIAKGKQFLERKQGKEVKLVDAFYKDVVIQGNFVSLNHKDAMLDLGSIAKGYIAERIADYLEEQGAESGYVDARGDIKFFGSEQIVAVQHPRNNSIICNIKILNKGVATSGDYKQYDKIYDKSHVINKKEIISATVVADDLTEADVFATLLMVCKKEERDKLMQGRNIMAMTVDNELKIHYYNGFEKIIADEI